MATKEVIDFENKRAELLRQLAELEEKENEAKTAHFAQALKYLEDKKIDFDDLVDYYKKNTAKTIFQVDYLEPSTKLVKTFTRRAGEIGAISNEMKMILRGMGRDELAKGVKDPAAGAKVLESIFKDRAARGSKTPA